ncbi:MAG: hypothetical protein ABSD02_20680 [Steroidobacteraceae bacterium]|jgi:hypothetical protein
MRQALDKTWFDKALEQLQLGESLISEGVDGLSHGWKVSAEAIGKLRTGADRWHTVLREMQASTVNLADILRARTNP